MCTDFDGDDCAGRGLTLVELAVVAVAIAVILAFMIPVLREREHAKLQALATASPGEVFELHCYPAKEVVRDGEDDFIILGELFNPTGYALDIAWSATMFSASEGKMSYMASWTPVDNLENGVEPGPLRSKPQGRSEVHTVAPRSTLLFKARLMMEGTVPVDELTGRLSIKSADIAIESVRGVDLATLTDLPPANWPSRSERIR